MMTTYSRTQEYLARFDIDAAYVVREGSTPEGYFEAPKTKPKLVQADDGTWGIEFAWKRWPEAFDYEEFSRLIWQDSFAEAAS